MDEGNKKYTEEAIFRLAGAFNRKEEDYMWLAENDCKELAALRDYLVFDSSKACDWISRFNYPAISGFIEVVGRNKGALEQLLNNDCKEWAALFSAIDSDKAAMAWLMKHNYQHYAFLASTILKLLRKGSTGDFLNTSLGYHYYNDDYF